MEALSISLPWYSYRLQFKMTNIFVLLIDRVLLGALSWWIPTKRFRKSVFPFLIRMSVDANETETTASKCTLCLRYNSMLGMDFIGSEEMVIVEQPWLSVVATFPAALERRVYGS
jgi:hypothetical protein